jgi:hypothetical protein
LVRRAEFGLLSYCLQARSAEAIGVVGRKVEAFVFSQPDITAVALGDVAHFAFEGGLTAGAGFCFVLAHNWVTGTVYRR